MILMKIKKYNFLLRIYDKNKIVKIVQIFNNFTIINKI
jgi:hypothetical protein